ncbi:hypothetical protein BH23PLA1_BH23PLA1_38860 [soil metagenome]
MKSWKTPDPAAEAMRRILVEPARRRATRKRGGSVGRVPLEEVETPAVAEDERLLAVHEALDELARIDPEAATLVKLRFFAGMSAALRASVRQDRRAFQGCRDHTSAQSAFMLP